MRARMICIGLVIAAFAAIAVADNRNSKHEAYKPSTVSIGDIAPPRVVPPCKPGQCPFAGQTVNVLIVKEANGGAFGELKNEFEAATGAKLNLV